MLYFGEHHFHGRWEHLTEVTRNSRLLDMLHPVHITVLRNRWILRLLILVSSSLLLVSQTCAQERRRYEISAGYSYQRANTSVGPFNLNGASVSVVRNMNSWLGIVGDLGGYHAEGFREATYLFGPRVSGRLRGKASTFGEFLFGGVHASAGARGLPFYTNGIATAIGGGIDYHVSRRFSIRAIQIEYLQTRLGNAVQHNTRATIGLVYQFGASQHGKDYLPPNRTTLSH
jgi:hypothetical protein